MHARVCVKEVSLCYHLYEEVCFHETKRLWAGVCHLLLIAVFSVKRLI